MSIEAALGKAGWRKDWRDWVSYIKFSAEGEVDGNHVRAVFEMTVWPGFGSAGTTGIFTVHVGEDGYDTKYFMEGSEAENLKAGRACYLDFVKKHNLTPNQTCSFFNREQNKWVYSDDIAAQPAPAKATSE